MHYSLWTKAVIHLINTTTWKTTHISMCQSPVCDYKLISGTDSAGTTHFTLCDRADGIEIHPDKIKTHPDFDSPHFPPNQLFCHRLLLGLMSVLPTIETRGRAHSYEHMLTLICTQSRHCASTYTYRAKSSQRAHTHTHRLKYGLASHVTETIRGKTSAFQIPINMHRHVCLIKYHWLLTTASSLNEPWGHLSAQPDIFTLISLNITTKKSKLTVIQITPAWVR